MPVRGSQSGVPGSGPSLCRTAAWSSHALCMVLPLSVEASPLLVQDRAMVREELGDLVKSLQASTGETAPEPEIQEPAAEAAECPLETLESGDKQVRTVAQILKHVRQSDKPYFRIGEAESLGEKACLNRLRDLVSPIRDFIRLARVNEGILSPATLLQGHCELNEWNTQQHQLALARREANLSQTRLSRSQAWCQAQSKWCAEVAKKVPAADGEDQAIRDMQDYRPCVEDKDAQILVYSLDGEVKICLCLSVFRGSVVKKAGAESGQVRVSKPIPTKLSCACTKMVHAAELRRTTQGWVTSVLAVPLLLEHTDILGEILPKEVKATATRFHVTLSANAEKALEIAKKNRLPTPMPTAADMPAVTATKPGMPTYFNDRSFMKAGLSQQIEQFLRGLQNAYDNLGQPFVIDGKVRCNKKLPSGKVSKIDAPWADLCKRVPSFFMKECSQLQGYRFSQAVHGVLVPLVPKGRALLGFSCPCIAFLFRLRRH